MIVAIAPYPAEAGLYNPVYPAEAGLYNPAYPAKAGLYFERL